MTKKSQQGVVGTASAAASPTTIAGGVSRRRIIHGAGAVAGLLAAPSILTFGRAQADVPSQLFTLGVASGDPRATSVVLWTRLAPDPLNGGGMAASPVPVTWKIATDPQMQGVVAGGVVSAIPTRGHNVTVTATGLLPDSWYYYQFEALGERSRIGRTRTFPLPGRQADRMRFAVVSCQHYETGYYAAWRDIARWRYRDNLDIDFVVHTGDYIYEGAPSRSPWLPGRVHSGTTETFTLEDYRNRYSQYRLDLDLQDAHANYPFIVTPDDHEVENNYAGLTPEEGAEKQGAEFAQRRRAAYRVYAEMMPLRGENRFVNANGKLHLFRRFRFGDLADLHVLDTRQYRSDQPAQDGFGSTDPDSAALESAFGEALFDAAGITDPNATMMGATQEQWLADGLQQSTARWNVIAQQVMLTRWNLVETGRLTIALNPGVPDAVKAQLLAAFAQVDNLFNVDAWDGYQAARQRLFNVLDTVRPNNPVVVTGDIHSAWAANLLKDFDDPNSDVLAAEFVCTSISSTFLGIDPRPTHAIVKAGVVADNPHIPYFNGLFRGYCLCDVNHRRFKTVYRAVGDVADLGSSDPLALVPRADSPVATDAVVTIPAGFNVAGNSQRIDVRSARQFPAPY